MDLELKDKHVLITGGSKGIGLACARSFLIEGARVSLVSRGEENLHAAADALTEGLPGARERIFGQAADLRDATVAAAAVDAVERGRGPVDILVNSAGAAMRTPPEALTPQHWRDAMDAKYFTYINVIDPLVKRMAGRGRGVILNVVGVGGKVASATHLPGGAANAALMLASAGLASVYGPKGIRINVVNPAMTLTERLKEGLAADGLHQGISAEEVLANASARLPLGRVARPEEIADAVLFLCSVRASYISGAVLSMDGALHPIVV